MYEYKTIYWLLSFLLMALLPGYAQSTQLVLEHGTIGMQGSIIDTPCAIALDDLKQTIEMGIETTGGLMHDNHGLVRFHIRLVDCTLKPSSSGKSNGGWFRVTFDGKPDGNLFGVDGADGVGVQIMDCNGHIVLPGISLPSSAIFPGDQTLEYTLQLVKDHRRLRAGSYRSTIRFKTDYF